MAKLKSDTPATPDAFADTAPIATGEGTTPESAQPSGSNTPTQRIEPHIDRVLKAFPNSQNLYVDAHGGAFTTDTPQVIRKGAKLYNNPHYES